MTEAMRLETIPGREEIAQFYADICKHPMQHGLYRATHQIQRLERMKQILTFILPFAPRVLEAGCADGMITEWLAERTVSVVGADIAEACIDRAWASAAEKGLDNLEYVHGDIMELLPELGEFDLALCSEIIEHQIDPDAFVLELSGQCRAILATAPLNENPNPNAFSVEAFYEPKAIADGTGHIWYFRADTFQSLFDTIWHYERSGVSGILLGRRG